jgi:hypothetical protein
MVPRGRIELPTLRYSPHLMISPRVGETEIGIAARRAMLTLTTVTGNIWMLDNADK